MSALCWVVGRGLLGSPVAAALSADETNTLFTPPRFPWRDPAALTGEMQRAVAEFASRMKDFDSWRIIWTAGVGVMGTAEEDLRLETAVLSEFLAALGKALPAGTRGTMFLSSSAGGVYTVDSGVIDESSPTSAGTPYGREKLRQEELFRAWLQEHTGVRGLIGRISTLYGPGQNLAKQQGLISHMSQSLLKHKPISVFVPLDTIRDYLYVDDCARMIVCALDALEASQERCVMKIFAAGQVTTIAQLVGIFKALAKTNPRIIQSRKPLAADYPRAIRFRSAVWPDLRVQRTQLIDGIARLHRYQLEAYARA